MVSRRLAKISRSEIPFSEAKIARPLWCDNPELARRVEHSLEVLNGISRTFKGESNTDSSELKVALKYSGRALQRKVRFNYWRTGTELSNSGTPSLSSLDDTKRFILSVAASMNSGLQQEGVPQFRFWKTKVPHHPAPEDIPRAFDEFCRNFQRLLPEALHCRNAAVRMAAWIEQQFNGRDHALSDGCGRTSRMLSFFILDKHGVAVPTFKNREEYFKKINTSDEEWHEYYRSALEAKGITRS